VVDSEDNQTSNGVSSAPLGEGHLMKHATYKQASVCCSVKSTVIVNYPRPKGRQFILYHVRNVHFMTRSRTLYLRHLCGLMGKQ